LHHRQITGLLALHDASSIDAHLMKRVRQASSVTHEAVGHHVVAYIVHRGNRVTGRQRDDLFALDDEEGVARDDERTRVLLHETHKCSVEVALAAGLRNVNLKTKRAGRRLYIACIHLVPRVIGIDQDTDHGGVGNDVMENPYLLLQELLGEEGGAREIPVGTIKAPHKAQFDRITADDEHYGNRRGRRFGHFCWEPAERGNHGYAPPNQLRRKGRQFNVLLCRPVLDRHVAAFDKAAFAQSLAEGGHPLTAQVIKDTNYRQRLLLRARRERPRCRAAKKRDELTPLHVLPQAQETAS